MIGHPFLQQTQQKCQNMKIDGWLRVAQLRPIVILYSSIFLRGRGQMFVLYSPVFIIDHKYKHLFSLKSTIIHTSLYLQAFSLFLISEMQSPYFHSKIIIIIKFISYRLFRSMLFLEPDFP